MLRWLDSDRGFKFTLVGTLLGVCLLLIIGYAITVTQDEHRSAICVQPQEDVLILAPKGADELTVHLKIHNCGYQAWEQGEFTLVLKAHNMGQFVSFYPIPETAGGKDAQIPVRALLYLTPGPYQLAGEFQVVDSEGKPLGHPVWIRIIK